MASDDGAVFSKFNVALYESDTGDNDSDDAFFQAMNWLQFGAA